MLNLAHLFKKKSTCWEAVNCNPGTRNKCPYYLNKEDYNCWEVEGTFCHGDIAETSGKKLLACSRCDYYATQVWGLQPSQEHKQHIRKALHKDIIHLSQTSVNEAIDHALQELKVFHIDIQKRVTLAPWHKEFKLFSDFAQLKILMRELISQALDNLPPNGQITISADDHAGHEIKVVLTSPHSELMLYQPEDLPDLGHSFSQSAAADNYHWVLTLGKDRRTDNRRTGPRRAAAPTDKAVKVEKRRSSDRRQGDRRFATISA